MSITVLAEASAQRSNQILPVCTAFHREEDYPQEVLRQVRTIDPDILHIQHEYGIFGLDDRFLRLMGLLREYGTRTVVTLHTVHTRLSFHGGCASPDMRRLLRKVNIENYQRQIGELADLVIVHQENPIRKVLLRQGLSRLRVVTLPHGTRVLESTDAPKAKAALGIEPDSPVILAFGYFELSKNFALLIKAFSRIKKRVSNAKLWLGGYLRFPTQRAVAYRARCLRLIEQLGLKEDVIFVDRMVPEEQLPELLTAADITCFVYDEDTHSSSGALHLAMGLGKAVVASRTPKFHELTEVSDEILVNPRSCAELYEVLARLLLDKPFREYIEKRVRSYARRTAWIAVARKHRLLYERLIDTTAPCSQARN